MLGTLVKPARRHRCELCLKIFECGICEFHWPHPAHNVIGNDPIVYVCHECVSVPNIMVISTAPKGNIARLYDYKTGKLLDAQPIPGRKMSMKIWTSFDKIPNIAKTSKVFEAVKFYDARRISTYEEDDFDNRSCASG